MNILRSEDSKGRQDDADDFFAAALGSPGKQGEQNEVGNPDAPFPGQPVQSQQGIPQPAHNPVGPRAGVRPPSLLEHPGHPSSAFGVPPGADVTGHQRLGPRREIEKPLTTQEAKRKSHRDHAKKSRDRLIERFTELAELVMPPANASDHAPPPGRSKVLESALTKYMSLKHRHEALKLELVLSNQDRLSAWIWEQVSNSPDLGSALRSLLSLVCTTRDWVCGEVWVPHPQPNDPSNPSTCLRRESHFIAVQMLQERSESIGQFIDSAQRYGIPPSVGLIGRAYTLNFPEWCPDLSLAAHADERLQLAVRAGLTVACAIPVSLNNAVLAVATFYNDKHSEYNSQMMITFRELGTTIANSFFKCRPAQPPPL